VIHVSCVYENTASYIYDMTARLKQRGIKDVDMERFNGLLYLTSVLYLEFFKDKEDYPKQIAPIVFQAKKDGPINKDIYKYIKVTPYKKKDVVERIDRWIETVIDAFETLTNEDVYIRCQEDKYYMEAIRSEKPYIQFGNELYLTSA